MAEEEPWEDVAANKGEEEGEEDFSSFGMVGAASPANDDDEFNFCACARAVPSSVESTMVDEDDEFRRAPCALELGACGWIE